MSAIPLLFSIAGAGKPSVGADAIDASIWQNNAFGATSDVQAIAGSAKGAAMLYIPQGATASAMVYGMKVSTTVQATVRIGFYNGPAPAGWTKSPDVASRHLPSTGSPSTPQGAVYWTSAAAALAAGTFFSSLILAAGQSPYQSFPPTANAVLRSASGLVVLVDPGASAASFAVSFDFLEFGL